MQSDMGKAGDPGVAGGEIAASAVSRPRDEFDGIAARIGEHNGRIHPALLAFAARGCFDDVAGIVEFRAGGIELCQRPEFKRHRMLARVADGIHQSMVAAI